MLCIFMASHSWEAGNVFQCFITALILCGCLVIVGRCYDHLLIRLMLILALFSSAILYMRLCFIRMLDQRNKLSHAYPYNIEHHHLCLYICTKIDTTFYPTTLISSKKISFQINQSILNHWMLLWN